MRLQFKSRKPETREPLLRPLPYSQGGIRLRLMLLVGMLMLVLVAMREAGKPENWAWLGFAANPAATSPEGETVQLVSEDDRSPGNPSTSAELSRTAGTDSPNRPTTEGQSAAPSLKLIDLAAPLRGPDGEVDYPDAAARFWRELFPRLSAPRQAQLMSLMRRSRPGGSREDEANADFAVLVSGLKNKRDEFHQELFDRLTLMPDAAQEKPRLLEQYDASDELWSRRIAPALSALAADEELTIDQQQALQQLQMLLDQLVYGLVEDRTAQGWAGDAEAWKRIWEQVQGAPWSDVPAVTRLQLMSQPALFRGRPVTLEGWVRSARRQPLAEDTALNLEAVYVLWVRPEESNAGPYCVYLAKLPEDFPEVGPQYRDLNEHVQISGMFFKVRSYLAADNQVQYAPVLVGQQLVSVEAPRYTAVDRWQPATSTWWWLLGGLPILATLLAWGVYRGSLTRRHAPGKREAAALQRQLGQLQDDPEIMTDQQRVAAWAQQTRDSE